MDFLDLKPRAFGLDISDHSFKLVKLQSKKGFSDIEYFADLDIPDGIIEKGEIKDKEAMKKKLLELFGQVNNLPLRQKYCMVSLPEEKSFSQIIQMPKLSLEELDSALRYQIQSYIPLPLEKVYFDWHIIEPLVDHLDHYDILVVAYPKEIVDEYLEVLTEMGLIPLAFENESFSIARAVIKDGVSLEPVSYTHLTLPTN